ncbi:hypothetical protein WJX74_007614 [Apatococcus lobatus]|uniref:Elongation factor Ts, mitochondrial n=1 Tax=Apatococcus lobatus TaxID=904363 RepID=A0AAW1QUE4_9CHLO
MLASSSWLVRQAKGLSLRSHAAAASNLQLIKALREKSGAPMSEVKAALEEASWDEENAYQALRKKGLAAVSKKASRVAAEGLIGISMGKGTAAVVEVNCETDFVARNDGFRSLVTSVAASALNVSQDQAGLDDSIFALRPDALLTEQVEGRSIADRVSDTAAAIRENLALRRAFRVFCPEGLIASYLHSSPAAGLGRIGCLVALSSPSGPIAQPAAEHLQGFARELAMHVAATKPLYLDRESVPGSALAAERKVLSEQASSSKKPPDVIEKMVTGRLQKFYQEVCLLEQPFVLDTSLSIKQALKKHGQAAGVEELDLQSYIRLQVGEGIEKDSTSFAEEVAQTVSQAS